jgi:hypothetical protein
MSSTFSKNTTKAKFKKHHVHEVVTSINDSKQLATDYANHHRYRHKAEVSVVGTADLRVYDPIYLDGLSNGMSGYWTVLSIKHVFGGRPANYMMELVVGTDIIGDTSSTAGSNAGNRDIQGDLAGQSLTAPGAQLITNSPTVNSSSLTPLYGQTLPTPQVSPIDPNIPNLTGNPYPNTAPDLTQVKRTVQWKASGTGAMIL